MFVRSLTAVQVHALDRVEQRYHTREEAERAYLTAVVLAHELGCSNQAIAHRIGQSETAVRTWLRRRGYQRRR